jgi:hypothetical protein
MMIEMMLGFSAARIIYSSDDLPYVTCRKRALPYLVEPSSVYEVIQTFGGPVELPGRITSQI